MAMFGFVVMIILGVLFLVSGVFITFLGNAFGGSAAEGLVPVGIGGVLIWLAIHFAPFSIVIL